MRSIVYIASSLDGFIARENGDLDWLPHSSNGESGEGLGFKEFFDSIDALVMGSRTYEKVISFGNWPYGEKRVIVLSSKPVEIPMIHTEFVSHKNCSPHELIRELSEKGVKRIYVDGGKTIQGFLDAGLIDEIIITRIPILIGQGIPLFGSLEEDIQLKHLETHSFESGFVQSRYEVIHESDG